ncbi:hypothetical protein GP486_001374 [Trichoglossum hirsutum]|uniref:U1-type domain-containing protein n=1 Tax=Trichoglossum hirsutum TaxID=265104 RepID=A0A9P8RSP6_9PEZI|nr:hypothetical protein GP486_001374 [Trichoglossum hirsutum]
MSETNLLSPSQPKYWCKHCKTYVRDTKLEKQNHEATLKHQGNLKRFLRDLHRGHERGEREKQRAKDEVERLNNVVSGTAKAGRTPPWERRPAVASAPPAQRQITPAERKQQIAQLAELGVAIPEELRGEMAMAGEWQTISERVIGQQRGEDAKPDSIGVRKRKVPEEESDEEDADTVTKKGWGSTIKTYPKAGEDLHDLDALLKKTSRNGKGKAEEPVARGNMDDDIAAGHSGSVHDPCPTEEKQSIKREDSEEDTKISNFSPEESLTAHVAAKVDESLEVMFKKRKVKNIRQK